MLSNQQRSRNVTTDTAVQSVFVMLQHLHPDLHRFMQLLENKRGEMSTTIILNPNPSFLLAYFENLQDKLTQLKDAREALNAPPGRTSRTKAARSVGTWPTATNATSTKVGSHETEETSKNRHSNATIFYVVLTSRNIWNINGSCIYNAWLNKKSKWRRVLNNSDNWPWHANNTPKILKW